MPPDPVLLHTLKTSPPDKVRQVLHAAMNGLADSDDWLEIERLVREHLGMQEAIRMLGEPGAPVSGARSDQSVEAGATRSRRPVRSRSRRR